VITTVFELLCSKMSILNPEIIALYGSSSIIKAATLLATPEQVSLFTYLNPFFTRFKSSLNSSSVAYFAFLLSSIILCKGLAAVSFNT